MCILTFNNNNNNNKTILIILRHEIFIRFREKNKTRIIIIDFINLRKHFIFS